jgi:hypothetical protein
MDPNNASQYIDDDDDEVKVGYLDHQGSRDDI